MSDMHTNLNEAILVYMKENGIKRGGDCPVLRVTLVGYDEKGEPLFNLRPATGTELRKAATGSMGKLEN